MIAADDFIAPARALGFDFYAGVPCSFLTPFINRAIGDPALDYVGAASEGEAIAIAAGAALAGRGTVVLCQNSGLGNTVNPLTSLNHSFQIPTLLITTWRGQPGVKDEPQHALMGRITHGLLELMRIPLLPFPTTTAAIEPALAAAVDAMDASGLPFALVMTKDTVRPSPLTPNVDAPRPAGTLEDRTTGGAQPTRFDLLAGVLEALPEAAAVIATTGKCGRELFTLADRPQHLYLVGSMGGAGALGLGVALTTTRPVVVLDGDGAALMKLGALATIGAHGAERLVHLILDNGVHDSTGGQATVSPHVDFAAVAVACGYRHGVRCDDVGGCVAALQAALGRPGPTLIHVRIKPGSIAQLGRPTITPPEVAKRFRQFLAG